MKLCDVQEMLKIQHKDPCFFVDFYNIGRGFVNKINDTASPWIKQTKQLKCWRINNNLLESVSEVDGILFDAETYLIQWTFELVANNETNEETIFYYWKGNNATKGFSPLPEEFENQNTIVERICQWSEPALFFHMFSRNVAVFSSKQSDFDPNATRLFMVRGELKEEIHLYEVPCLTASLRSRAIFILIEPSQQTIYYWYGASVIPELEQHVKKTIHLNDYEKSWANFERIEVNEGQDKLFLELLGSEGGPSVSIKCSPNFTPRLFYFNSITGDFLATEVEYPLRSSNTVSPFPFLQSHLYTATQPALFLLDNNSELWLWEGWKTQDSNLEIFDVEKSLAKKSAIEYSIEKEKSKAFTVPIKYIQAGLEPVDFINLFPYWDNRNDITDLQIKEGQQNIVTIIQK